MRSKTNRSNRRAGQRTLSYLWLLIGMVALLVCASFAWFSVSATPNVGDMSIFVNAPTGLQLALQYNAEDEDWGQNISFSDLVSEDAPLRPVTWSDEEQCFKAIRYGTDGRQTNSLKVLTDEKNANRTDDDQYYIVGVYYARTDSDTTVSLADAKTLSGGVYGAGTYVIGTPEWNENTGAHTNAGGGAQYAIRVGFRMTQVDPNTGRAVGDSTFLIYEPNADEHLGYGTQYFDTRSTDGTETLVDRDRLIVQSTSTWAEADPAQRDVTVKTLGDFVTEKKLFEIKAGQIVRIEMYIWIEGQDIDCYGLPEGAKLTANIQFSSSASSQSGMEDIPTVGRRDEP